MEIFWDFMWYFYFKIIHYYIGPSYTDSRDVAWIWKDYPIVIKPSSYCYDIIGYHKN